jgi:hypothetical protein
MRFIGFGSARTFSRDEISGELAQDYFEQDGLSLVCLLCSYFVVTEERVRPLLATIPHQGAIMKFLDA